MRLALLVVAYGVCVGLAGCGQRPPAMAPEIITPDAAVTVVADIVRKDSAANAPLDVAAERQILTGPLLDTTVASFFIAKFYGRAIPPYVADHIVTYVPHQTAYPAQFLTTYTTRSRSAQGKLVSHVAIVLATKESAVAGWKLAFEADTIGDAPSSALPAFALDKDGYATVVGMPVLDHGYAIKASVLPSIIGNVLTSGSNEVTGDILKEEAGNFAARKRERAANGISIVTAIAVRPDPIVGYALADGSVLTLVPWNLVSVFSTPEPLRYVGDGEDIAQPRAGAYSKVTVTETHQTAVVIPVRGVTGVATAVGDSADQVTSIGS